MRAISADGVMSLPARRYAPLTITEQFPGLRPHLHRFDGPGGTLVHGAVREAMADYLGSEHVANDHGAFGPSRYSDDVVDLAAGKVRELLGALGGHVLFGPNMTSLTTTFVRAVAQSVGPGDEIVCTQLDHEANVTPWAELARQRGAVLRMARLHPDGTLPVSSVLAEVTPRTRWVAITAASNALGTVPDVRGVVAPAAEVGARVFVDGVQSVAHRPADIAGVGCDAFVTSAYKWYGPHCGALWLREEVADRVSLPEQVPSAGAEPPGHLRLGTCSFESVLGTGVAAQVLIDLDRTELATREAKLAAALRGALEDLPGVRVLGPPVEGDHVPVVTFQVEGVPPAEAAAQMYDAGICVWDGTFYASTAMQVVAPGSPDALRAGIACYTGEDDVDALVWAVGRLGRRAR